MGPEPDVDDSMLSFDEIRRPEVRRLLPDRGPHGGSRIQSHSPSGVLVCILHIDDRVRDIDERYVLL